MSQDSTLPVSPKPKSQKSGPLDKFPAEVREAHARFLANGDVDSLDTVVLAVVRDHQPAHARTPEFLKLADSDKLMGSLGFDSLALAEIYATTSYYLQHRSSVDDYLKERQQGHDRLRQLNESRSDPAGLRERLLKRKPQS